MAAASKRTGFWTKKRLAELRKLFHKKQPLELTRHFGRHWEEIITAYEFDRQSRLMIISQERVKVTSRKSYKITVYRAAWAEGADSAMRYNGNTPQ